jgi:imidazolonepropionase-like amidohydrolase
MNATIIRNGRVIDPANKRNELADVYIANEKIVTSKSEIQTPKSEIEEVDAHGLIVAPGLIDMHVHLREPGFSHKETIESGARAQPRPADSRLSFVCRILRLFQTIRARLRGSKIGLAPSRA